VSEGVREEGRKGGREGGREGVSDANSAILHLYHGKNKLIFNEMMTRSALH
jgi:hypothetical protein